MSGPPSVNSRTQHVEDIERLVKCRLRSEIHARKAVVSAMKRAVLEARQLKKELLVLRQDNEELRATAQTKPINEVGKDSPIESKDDQIQRLAARNKQLESQSTTTIDQSTAIAEKDRKIAALEDELAKTKLVADETKRMCQSMLKEKREEAQRALHENEQLARCAKTLQSQLALLPQLKRQLEFAKEKRADMAGVWQKKLEQRDQAFLREEEASKQKLAESAFQIAELTEEKLKLQGRLSELEIKLRQLGSNHKNELSQESQRTGELETSINQWQEKIVANVAEPTEAVAHETQERETQLRLTDDVADAVEDQDDLDLMQAREAPKALRCSVDRLELSSNNEDDRGS